MELLCKIFGHKWQLVKPEPYQIIRNCFYRCKRCGEGKTMHKWQCVPNRCYDECEVCKGINNFPHDYKDGKCIRCGDPAPLPRKKLSYEESMQIPTRVSAAAVSVAAGNGGGIWKY